MKKGIILLLFILPSLLFAQQGLDEMIATEKAFAAYSVANNTKDAFLRFMDTSAVMFRNGEPYKAYEDWLKRNKGQGVLNWWPTHAEVSTGGDFGYTCGPWTFQSSLRDTIVATGYFFTVWQRNDKKEWKFILDIGTDKGPIEMNKVVQKIAAEKTAGTAAGLRDAEQAYLTRHQTSPKEAYNEFISDKSLYAFENGRIYRGGRRQEDLYLAIEPVKIDFEFKDSKVAPSGDLGYTYGTATRNGKKETYLRIWRHEPKGWKIALELVRL